MLAPVGRAQADRAKPPSATRPPQPDAMPDGSLADAPEDRIGDASAGAQQRLERLADAIARRTQLRLIQQKAGDDARQAKLDRLQQEFDFAQKERAELLREFNLMRDLALEQTKKDDEAVKKWMALV